ncbi:hypothetical protein ACIG87_31665 [Micromonospora sp. NPDC051925]|uniref:hypothetical protein n=1 Tax=Micromonospora sp. NPDC051925 TaxID=3364288 RepID=UPI0037C6CB81
MSDSAPASAKIEELGQELFEAVGTLHLALRVYVPAHNSWQPVESTFVNEWAGLICISTDWVAALPTRRT